MSMHNSSELANALNPHITQDHHAAYVQNYNPNYAQSFSLAQTLLQQQEFQTQQHHQQDLYAIADSSINVQYVQPQYLEQQQQDSQSELQNASALVPHQTEYSSPAQQHAYNGQQIQQAFPVSPEQQSQLQPQGQQEQERQQLHDQQRYYDASQAQPQSSTELPEAYSTNPSQIHHHYAAGFGDTQSSSFITPTNNSTLSSYPTPTTNYAAPTTTPIVQKIRTTFQSSQYPSPQSAHTTPHVQHHQVSMREAVNAQPAEPSSSFAVTSSIDVGQQTHALSTAVQTPAVANSHPPTAHNVSSHEQPSCEFTNMMPTPALEPRQKTPALHSLQQQTSKQPRASKVKGPALAVPLPSASASQQATGSSQQHQPQPARATDRMVQALPLFMMETFKVIRKEKDANEEERKRRAEWELSFEERQTRLEAELTAQKVKLDALEEKLTKRAEEQAKKEEELARKDLELAERDEELAREKEEVKEKLKDVDNKMAEMHAMIEAVRIIANTKAPLAPPPPPVVAETASSVVPTITPSVPIFQAALIDGPAPEPSGAHDNEQSPVEISSPQRLGSTEPFAMSPDLMELDDEELDLPPVSSIAPPKPQEGSQPVASTSAQPLHPNIMAPNMFPFPMPPPHAHNYPPAPGAYHFPTPVPYYPYPPLIPHNYDVSRPPLPPHTNSTSQFSDLSNQNAAAQYITPNLTPDLVPATVGRAPPPQQPPFQEAATSNQRKRKSKPKYQKKKKKKRRKQAADGDYDEDEGSGSEYASDDEDSSSEESEMEAEPKRRPKRANGHDKKIYTLPHALRVHIYSMMEIISDKELPDSHDENTIYHPSQPVRFVWEKTCKQSVHNARMKLLVLEDIKEKRARLYPKVPVEDFSNKAVMEKKFDNVFETMRGKYKAQRSEELAQKEREREAKKARNSRHLARKVAKLSDRSESRMKMPKYEPVVFDPALLRECMSSDESDVEVDPVTQVKVDIYRSRGPAWRSGRLVKLYNVLEDNKVIDPNVRPKGGVGRKRPRRIGPPKDEFMLPPKGVAPWMVSRKWVQKAKKTHVDLESVLGKLVADEHVLDGDMYEELGDESEVDEESETEADVPAGQDQQETHPVSAQSAQMRTLRLGLQPQELGVGPAFSGRYTLQ